MKGYTINHNTKEIVITSTFNNASSNPMTEEFKVLAALVTAFPAYQIKSKTNPNNKGDKTTLAKIESEVNKAGDTALTNEFKKMKNNKENFLVIKKWYNKNFKK